MKAVLDRLEQRILKRINYLEKDFAAIRAGRANPAVLDKLTIDYYGAPTPVNQIAAVSVTEARTLTIQPWDASALKLVEKAILTSDIGINPQNDGKLIRLIFPPLTEDRRKEIAKEIGKLAEETKVSVRNVRRDAIDDIKELKKNNEITEDDQKLGEKKVQEITDKYIKNIETMAEKKQKEIMEI